MILKKLLLTGIAALFLATGMMVIAARSAHAQTVCAGKYEQKVDFDRCMRDWVDPQPVDARVSDTIPAECFGPITDRNAERIFKLCGDLSDCVNNPNSEVCKEFDRRSRAKPIAFRPWRQVWQCNDIRIVEFSNRQGLIEYDLSGAIWGGSQFARDLNRDMLFFNGRPCVPLR